VDTNTHTEANGSGRRGPQANGRSGEPAEVLVDALRRLFGARSDIEVRSIEREARERLAGVEDEARLISELEESTAVAFEHVDRWNAVAERADMRTAELAVRTRELEDANAGVRELLNEATVRTEDLQAAVDYQRAILNTLAHEVRGPLTAGDLMLDEILSDHDLSGVEAENIADARRCIAEAVRIVNEQLQRAKLEAGVLRPREEEVSIADLYLALRGMVRALRRSEAVSLEFASQPDLPPLVTDPHMLGQILRNLISNALKFTDEGTVKVSARFDQSDETFVFEVADTGVGVAPGDRERIFEDFGQVAAAQRAGGAGTGLGLPLSRTLAQTLGGSLELADHDTPGSTFAIRLPATPSA
jgi:signal transduction histidine kinase